MEYFINDWTDKLEDVTSSEFFKKVMEDVNLEYCSYPCAPRYEDIFRAFNLCSFENTKVVIIGQDPYHTKGMANGLAFSVNDGVKVPPSLRNIIKEIQFEYGEKRESTDFTSLAKQGVLLLNSSLTVREGKPLSHINIRWDLFTRKVVELLGKEDVVFILLGSHAKKFEKYIKNKDLVITAPHPSPLSAHGGFYDSGIFMKANELLEELGKEKIDWLH